MFTEDELLPLSALQHLLFCERRAFLVHVERAWQENRFTARGGVFHSRVHDTPGETRGNLRIARGIALRSLQLGLSGKADVVEFHCLLVSAAQAWPDTGLQSGVALPGSSGLWRPFPVEYKQGRLRPEESYEVQLCAQALCLEEMLNVVVPNGALFYGATRRRAEIVFDESLRRRTEEAAAHLHQLFHAHVPPKAVFEKKCKSCSLLSKCMPREVSRHSAKQYLSDAIDQLFAEDSGRVT